MGRIWDCKIGECEDGDLDMGADSPMRRAVEAAYREVTGKEPDFCFSGWGGELTPVQQEVVDRKPADDFE